MTDILFADAITSVSYANGVLRVSLGRQTRDNSIEDAGMLVLPVSQAGQVANYLTNSLKQLEVKMREMQEQESQTPAANQET